MGWGGGDNFKMPVLTHYVIMMEVGITLVTDVQGVCFVWGCWSIQSVGVVWRCWRFKVLGLSKDIRGLRSWVCQRMLKCLKCWICLRMSKVQGVGVVQGPSRVLVERSGSEALASFRRPHCPQQCAHDRENSMASDRTISRLHLTITYI